eukprot:scaffold87397_cov70-Cyclotella_meneghiniana.AAC.11
MISLPPQAIGEIRSIISNRNTSPRGVNVNHYNKSPCNLFRLSRQAESRLTLAPKETGVGLRTLGRIQYLSTE